MHLMPFTDGQRGCNHGGLESGFLRVEVALRNAIVQHRPAACIRYDRILCETHLHSPCSFAANDEAGTGQCADGSGKPAPSASKGGSVGAATCSFNFDSDWWSGAWWPRGWQNFLRIERQLSSV